MQTGIDRGQPSSSDVENAKLKKIGSATNRAPRIQNSESRMSDTLHQINFNAQKSIVTSCPEFTDLSQFLLGKMVDSDFVLVEAHIGACEVCQLELARISSDLSNSGLLKSESSHAALPADLVQRLAGKLAAKKSTTDHLPTHVNRAEFTNKKLGDYRINLEIGRGGMGVVYEAEQISLGRRVALKIMSPGLFQNESSQIRFQREAAAAASLHHTNIVPVYEAGQDNGTFYYAMQLIHGDSLDVVRDELRQSRSQTPVSTLAIADEATIEGESNPADIDGTALNAGEPTTPGHSCSSPNRHPLLRNHYHFVADIGRQTAGALHHAHERGVIHRDVKPSNLILDENGVVWLADFGLAKQLDDNLTASTAAPGTMRYMSPERFQGQVEPRADVYALGASLYELLTLEPAFQSKDQLSLLEQIKNIEPKLPRMHDKNVPLDLQTIIAKSMAKEPSDRYPNALEMKNDLARFLDGQPVSARRISTAERFWRWSKKHKALSAALAALVLLTILTAVGSGIAAVYFRDLAIANSQLATQKENESNKAKQNTQLALATIETIIETVQYKLRHIPGARTIRRELLESTLRDLETIVEDPSFQSRANRNTAKIMVDLGLLYVEFGDKGGGQAHAQANKHLRRAVEIFEEISPGGSSTDPATLLDQARALSDLGHILRDQNHLPEAELRIRQALEICRRLVVIEPENLDFQHRLARTLWELSNCLFELERTNEASRLAGEALAAAQEVDRIESIESSLSLVHACQVMIGDVAQQEDDRETAFHYYSTSLSTAENYLRKYPQTPLAYDYLSLSYECLGDYWRQGGNLDKSKRYYLKMLESLQQAIQYDDEDRSLKEGVACAYTNLFGIHREMGDLETAQAYKEKRNELDAWLAQPRE